MRHTSMAFLTSSRQEYTREINGEDFDNDLIYNMIDDDAADMLQS